MKKALLSVFILCYFLALNAQVSPAPEKQPDIKSMVIRPNSRDYAIVRRDNNHQRILQIRREIMIQKRQAIINRQILMERRRQINRERLLRQQQIRQRMIRRRNNLTGN
jgi:hypothetical protein